MAPGDAVDGDLAAHTADGVAAVDGATRWMGNAPIVVSAARGKADVLVTLYGSPTIAYRGQTLDVQGDQTVTVDFATAGHPIESHAATVSGFAVGDGQLIVTKYQTQYSNGPLLFVPIRDRSEDEQGQAERFAGAVDVRDGEVAAIGVEPTVLLDQILRHVGLVGARRVRHLEPHARRWPGLDLDLGAIPAGPRFFVRAAVADLDRDLERLEAKIRWRDRRGHDLERRMRDG